MRFPDRFRDHLLSDRMEEISVCFTAPEMRREFGGCAGNVAYTLKLLGGDPLPMATVGHDFGPYASWMDRTGVERRFVTEVDAFTAQAFITTDTEGNQITTFHPGAMDHAHVNSVKDAGPRPDRDRDPGRAPTRWCATPPSSPISAFRTSSTRASSSTCSDRARSRASLDEATWLTVNSYEWSLIQERSGLDAEEIASRVEAVIVTRGEAGSTVLGCGRDPVEIPAVPAPRAVDPTGCGDAYRAGLLLGLETGLDWETTGRIASLAGAIKVGHAGCQNHRFDPDGFAARFRDAFGYSY